MSRPVISVDPETTVLAASKLMGSKNIKRLLVSREQQPAGIVTQTDITSGLISMSPSRYVVDLMTREVVTIDETATMTEAAQIMAANGISCVVIQRAGKAAGIVTEKDIVQHVARSHGDPTSASVTEMMSFPIVTVPPSHSVMSASRMMDQFRIHRLLVGSTTDIQGIVTQTDVIAATQRKLEEARRARSQHHAEMGHLVIAALTNLSSIRNLLDGLLCQGQSVDRLEAPEEYPGAAPPARLATSRGNRDKTTCYGFPAQELESRVNEAGDCLARLAGMLGVRTSAKPTLTMADPPMEMSGGPLDPCWNLG
jgi:CBS domain-containing protein